MLVLYSNDDDGDDDDISGNKQDVRILSFADVSQKWVIDIRFGWSRAETNLLDDPDSSV